MKWYLKVLRHYADFKGRARRREYWMFVLFNLIFLIVAGFLDNIFHLNLTRTCSGMCGGMWMYGGMCGGGVISLLYSLFIIIPALAVTVRRLHDTGRSGWMILIGLIPLVGQIWLLVLMILNGTPGENKYGANPKELAA